MRYEATVITLACLGRGEEKVNTHRGDTANRSWQDESVKQKQLGRQRKKKKDREMEFDCCDTTH